MIKSDQSTQPNITKMLHPYAAIMEAHIEQTHNATGAKKKNKQKGAKQMYWQLPFLWGPIAEVAAATQYPIDKTAIVCELWQQWPNMYGKLCLGLLGTWTNLDNHTWVEWLLLTLVQVERGVAQIGWVTRKGIMVSNMVSEASAKTHMVMQACFPGLKPAINKQLKAL